MDVQIIEKFLPDILKQFNILYAYVFNEDKIGYMVIKRAKSMPLQNWDVFERICCKNFDFEKLFLISDEELTVQQLAEIKQSALHIEGGYRDE